MRSIRALRTAGFSLVEMLIVVVMIGLAMAFAFPRAGAIYYRSQVKAARNLVVNKFNSARMQARQTGMTVRFQQSNDEIWFERSDGLGGWVTVGSVSSLEAMYGVSSSGANTVAIDPRGLSLGTATIRLGRNGVRDSVVIFGYGGISR